MAEPTPVSPLDQSLLDPPVGETPAAPVADALEEALEKLAALGARSAYADAARAAETLLQEGVRDVRLVGPYLFGAFLERGLLAMPEIFSFLARFLGPRWDSFGPAEKKIVYAQSNLRGLLKMLNKHLEHHERSQDEDWTRWREADNRAPVQEALALAGEVSRGLVTALPESGCDRMFRQLTTWLEAHLAAIADEAAADPGEPPSDAGADGPAGAATEPHAPGDASPAAPDAARARSAGPTVPVSPALALLLRKLDAFDTLLEQRDLARATVVASDILHTLDHFDPRLYLPTLFSRFFSGLSGHADTVERMLQNTESLAFRALEQLYRVDLDAFLAQRSEPEE